MGELFSLLHELDHKDGLLESGGWLFGHSSTDTANDPASGFNWNYGETYTTRDIDRVLGACGLPKRERYDDPDVMAQRARDHRPAGFNRTYELEGGATATAPPEATAAPLDDEARSTQH